MIDRSESIPKTLDSIHYLRTLQSVPPSSPFRQLPHEIKAKQNKQTRGAPFIHPSSHPSIQPSIQEMQQRNQSCPQRHQVNGQRKEASKGESSSQSRRPSEDNAPTQSLALAIRIKRMPTVESTNLISAHTQVAPKNSPRYRVSQCFYGKKGQRKKNKRPVNSHSLTGWLLSKAGRQVQ